MGYEIAKTRPLENLDFLTSRFLSFHLYAMKKLNISNVLGHVNQYAFIDWEKDIFQSYQSICAIRDWSKRTITLWRDWDYSKTTLKHLKAFLDITLSAQEIRKAINLWQLGSFKLIYDEDLK